MFKKFDEKESISGSIQLKNSVQKSIRAKIIETYPHIEDYMENILPKKDIFKIVKWYKIQPHLSLKINILICFQPRSH